MRPKILALIEDTIGTKLLLSTRLGTLGYELTILSAPIVFRRQVEAGASDWIILDEAALPPVRQRFLDHLQRHRGEAHLVWFGKTPCVTRVPIEVTFDQPLHYDDIERFFSRWRSPEPPGVGHAGDALARGPVGQPETASCPMQVEGQEGPGAASRGDGTTARGDEDR